MEPPYDYYDDQYDHCCKCDATEHLEVIGLAGNSARNWDVFHCTKGFGCEIEPYVTSDGQVIQVIGYDVCPTCDYGVAPITLEGICLNCHLVLVNEQEGE